MNVSENSGFSSQIIHFNRENSILNSSILGYPHFRKHPDEREMKRPGYPGAAAVPVLELCEALQLLKSCGRLLGGSWKVLLSTCEPFFWGKLEVESEIPGSGMQI